MSAAAFRQVQEGYHHDLFAGSAALLNAAADFTDWVYGKCSARAKAFDTAKVCVAACVFAALVS